jgi:hypothetical protein
VRQFLARKSNMMRINSLRHVTGKIRRETGYSTSEVEVDPVPINPD